MAKPQIEDGYMSLANEIVEKLCKINLSPYQWRVLWAIWRKTYGWHKKGDKVAQTQLAELTGLARPLVNRALHQLINARLVTKVGKYLRFEKDYDTWKVISSDNIEQKLSVAITSEANDDKKLSPEITKKVITRDNKKLSVLITTKEKKDNNNILYKSIFDLWNEKKIHAHRKLTDDVRHVIVRTLRSYSVEEVMRAISNYAEIVHGREYYWSYRWTLKDFLKRGVERFLDLEIAKQNFKVKKDASKGQLPAVSEYETPEAFKARRRVERTAKPTT